MKSIKKAALTVAGIAVATVVLASCSNPNPQAEKDGGLVGVVSEVSVTLSDGRTIPCITWSRGIDCDWSAAER